MGVIFLEHHKCLINIKIYLSSPLPSLLATKEFNREEKYRSDNWNIRSRVANAITGTDKLLLGFKKQKYLFRNYFKMVEWVYYTDSGSPNRLLKNIENILFVESSAKIQFKIVEIFGRDWVIRGQECKLDFLSILCWGDLYCWLFWFFPR